MAELDAPTRSGVEYCRNRISHFSGKAEHNKREALFWFAATISCSLAAPLFITLGHGEFFGKIIPAVLSTIAAGGTAWLQQRKPQQLRALYRSAQRELENEAVLHEFGIGAYSDTDSPDRLLAKNVSAVVFRIHTSWLPIVPSPQPLKQWESTKEAKRKQAGLPS